MTQQDQFVDHLLELMQPWARITARKMFGGHGLYRDGLMFALIAFETLYFKIDAQSKAQFESAGCKPFVYEGKGRRVEMSYWTAPPECLEAPADMMRWSKLAWEAALRAQAAKKPVAKKTAAKKQAKKRPAR